MPAATRHFHSTRLVKAPIQSDNVWMATDKKPEKKPEWAPRIWEGLDFFAWIRLLVRNRFAVHWTCWLIAIAITSISSFHTFLRLIQNLFLGRRVRNTKIEHPPLFILGHWRNGTTLLHELLICDPRHSYPTSYECFEPNHFLLTERIFSKLFWFLMPAQRPMDNMKAGFDRPQEDEFALCMLGAKSPYLTIAFPNNGPAFPEYLDLEGVPPADVTKWKNTLLTFLKQITYRNPKRLVLKSPTHTARIKVLREMFPQAQFVHIVRNPWIVFPSTLNLWRTFYKQHGLQKPTYQGLEEDIFQTYIRMYERLEEGKKLLDPKQFYELKYEDLVADPRGELKKMYEHFGLGGYDELLPKLEEYLASVKGYETNKYQLDDAVKAEIARRWAPVIERYGYSPP